MKYIKPESIEICMQTEACLAVSLQKEDADPNADVLTNKKGEYKNPIWD